MSLFNHISRLFFIHRLIEKHATGTPEEFANKNRLSKSGLLKILCDMKKLGYQIFFNQRGIRFILAGSLLILCFLNLSCKKLPAGTTVFKIEEIVGRSLDGVMVVLEQHGQAVDTAVIENGKFKLEKLLWDKKMCDIMFWRFAPKGAKVPIIWGHSVEVLVDGSSKIVFRAKNADDILYNRYSIETDSKLISEFEGVRKLINRKIDTIDAKLKTLLPLMDSASKHRDDAKYTVLIEQVRELENLKKYIDHFERNNYILKRPNSYASIYWLSKASDIYVNTSFYTQIAQKLTPKFKQHRYGKDFLWTLADATKKHKDSAEITLDIQSNVQDWKVKQGVKLFVLDFWASWCGPCLEEMPGAMAQKRKLDKQKVQYVFLSYDTNSQYWMANNKKFGLSDSYLIAEKGYFTNLLSIHNIPRYVITNARGKVMVKYAGKPGSQRLIAQIDSCLKQVR